MWIEAGCQVRRGRSHRPWQAAVADEWKSQRFCRHGNDHSWLSLDGWRSSKACRSTVPTETQTTASNEKVYFQMNEDGLRRAKNKHQFTRSFFSIFIEPHAHEWVDLETERFQGWRRLNGGNKGRLQTKQKRFVLQHCLVNWFLQVVLADKTQHNGNTFTRKAAIIVLIVNITAYLCLIIITRQLPLVLDLPHSPSSPSTLSWISFPLLRLRLQLQRLSSFRVS